MNGRKDDLGKLRYDLMPVRALRAIVRVLTYGALKYAPENWRHVPDLKARYYAATMRHLEDWRDGKEWDDAPGGSGFRNLAGAACSIVFLLAIEEESSEVWRVPVHPKEEEEEDKTIG